MASVAANLGPDGMKPTEAKKMPRRHEADGGQEDAPTA